MARDGSDAGQGTGPAGEGEGRTPLLALGEFSGPLERLLMLARTRRIDLAGLALGPLADQLAAALQSPAASLARKGDWVVMASWLLQLRSLSLFPPDGAMRQPADDAAEQRPLCRMERRAMQALATWLECRPILGQDVFARAGLGPAAIPIGAAPGIDVVEFLWASLALFEDDAPRADTGARYSPRWPELHSIPDARARILRILGEAPEGRPLDTLLPAEAARAAPRTMLRRRSAWASTFAASLELARQGELVLTQEGGFTPIHAHATASGAPW